MSCLSNVKVSFRIVLKNIYNCSTKIFHIPFHFVYFISVKKFSSCLNILNVVD